MEKDLLLALSFNAPKELKDLALKHQENFLRLEKGNEQARLWLVQKDQYEKAYDRSAKEFRKAVTEWLKENVLPKEPEAIPLEEPKEVKK